MTEAGFKTDLSSISVRKKKNEGAFQRMDLGGLLTEVIEEESPFEIERRKLEEDRKELERKKEEVKSLLLSFQTAITQVKAEHDDWKKDVSSEMVELSLLVSEKIIEQEVKTSPEIIKNAVTRILDKSIEDKNRALFLNSEDCKNLRELFPEFMEQTEHAMGLEIHRDEHLARGVCKMDAQLRMIDTGTYRKLAFVWNRLVKEPRFEDRPKVEASEENLPNGDGGESEK